MKEFLVETPHTKEECMAELDDLAKRQELLSRFTWGCMAGEHTGYAILEADDERSARELVPPVVRSKARIHPVTRFTQDQIRSFHAR